MSPLDLFALSQKIHVVNKLARAAIHSFSRQDVLSIYTWNRCEVPMVAKV